jgi:hypothetical protein
MFDLFQVTVRCTDIPLDELAEAAKMVELEFRHFCPWHRNARCWVEGPDLVLRAQSDFDADGEALCDDLRCCLRDAVSTHGRIEVVSVEPLPNPPISGVLRVPWLPASHGAANRERSH